MVFNWFFGNSRKNEINDIKNDVKNSFSSVKTDIDKLSQWVNHFHNKHNSHENDFNKIKEDLSTMKKEIFELKDLVSSLNEDVSNRVFKTAVGRLNKQTAVYAVQTPVQTPVQTGNFYGISNLSITERAIVWLLANSELKLSYEDISAMLGKTKSTIRGQINSIRQKSGGLITEVNEKNGKKRVYMPEEIKEKVLKKAKVRVKDDKKAKKDE